MVGTSRAFLAALLFVGGSAVSHAQTTVEGLKEQGYARIAVANEPPITEVKPDGSVTGGAVEVARAVLQKMGVEDVTAVVSPFGAMIPGLQARRFDMITAGMFMRAERCQAILFSEPDICDAQGILTSKANEGITSYADVMKAGLRLGVIPGSHGQREARAAGLTDAMMTPVPDIQSGVKLLQDKRIDAYLLPGMSLADLHRKAGDDNLVIVAPLGGSSVTCAGVGFRKEDVALRDAYDVALKELKDSGEFKKILDGFGMNAELAMTTSREKLCGGPN